MQPFEQEPKRPDCLVLDSGPVLCLSGGGFRATLFHLGVARRMNELGLLSRLRVISSVSGGSIISGFLATRWSQLERADDGVFANFDPVIGVAVRAFCAADLRTPLLLGSRFNPKNWFELARNAGAVSGNRLADAYEKAFLEMNLTSLPDGASDVGPRFVFCSTNVQTGACWHFHGGPNGRMGDFYSGYTDTLGVSVATAVAASSAFPPGFAGLTLPASRSPSTRIDPWGRLRPNSTKRPPLRTNAHMLADGGVYDNLGVEPVWELFPFLLVSDAGRPFASSMRCPQSIAARLGRAAEISIEQVGAVRKRWLVGGFKCGSRRGALWAINTRIEDYRAEGALDCLGDARELFSAVRTDLNCFSAGEMACLENHGYSLADAALRTRVLMPGSNPPSPDWPNPAWTTNEKLKSALKKSASRRLARDSWRYLASFARIGHRSQRAR